MILNSLHKQAIIVLATVFTTFVSAAIGQELSSSNGWPNQKKELTRWVKSVNSIKCNFSLSKFTNPKYRMAAKQKWQILVKNNPNMRPEPDDSNYLFSYFWVADQHRWRCDKNRFYPKTGYDFSQYIYDGERFSFFSEYFDRGVIGDVDDKIGFVKDTQSNIWLGLSAVNMIAGAEAAGLGNFKRIDDENVAGRKCSVYKSTNEKGELTVDIDNEYHLLTKWKEITHGSESYSSILIYQWSDIRKVSNIPVPFRCKFEAYDVDKSVISWAQTVVFKLNNCEINAPVGRGYFENVLRIGTAVEDNVEDPGQISYVGGNLTAEAESVRVGTPPPLGIQGAKVADTIVPETKKTQESK